MSPSDPILIVHCYYQQPGGEDTGYLADVSLLEAHGHRVERFEVHNDEIAGMSRIGAATRAIWNRDAAGRIQRRVQQTGARIVHFHNTFPLLSPAVYGGAHAGGARVVQTLYNYRLVCPSALMLRDGKPCHACVGRTVPWPAVQHACYRNDRMASAAVAAMLVTHRLAGTFQHDVDAYIAVSNFVRERVLEGGLPRERVFVKGAHVTDDPGSGCHDGGYALYAGRLSEEKGIGVVLEAWRRLQLDVPLRIVGDGPLAGAVAHAAAEDPRITWDGHLDRAQVREHMRRAWLLLVPSICYDSAPLVLPEAAAGGLPVVASRLG
ncbi:MAG: glycosyltransferase, partial [Longimicrobiales bacterium]